MGLVGYGIFDTCAGVWCSAGLTGPFIQIVMVFTLPRYTIHIFLFPNHFIQWPDTIECLLSQVGDIYNSIWSLEKHTLIGAAHTLIIDQDRMYYTLYE